MVLFAVNTGARGSNVCALERAWEVPAPEIGRSVFVIPPEAFKSKRAHVVILNDIAWSIIESQRGLHPILVFPYRGRPVSTMNNTAWQRARREEKLHSVRIHDLRHTFGCRLRAAGVPVEDREVLPITRSQIEFALGLAAGCRKTSIRKAVATASLFA
jgi:integrase